MPGSKRPDKAQGRGAVSRLRSLLGKKGGAPSFPGAKPRPRFGLPDVDVPQHGPSGQGASNEVPLGAPSGMEDSASEEFDDALPEMPVDLTDPSASPAPTAPPDPSPTKENEAP